MAKKSPKNQAGKGDKPRPIAVKQNEYELNWERTFGSSKKKLTKTDELDNKHPTP